jgi:hypothetical protein
MTWLMWGAEVEFSSLLTPPLHGSESLPASWSQGQATQACIEQETEWGLEPVWTIEEDKIL